MHKSTTDWGDIAIFLHTVRLGSARATAAKLNISHSTVSRRVANLEKSLGILLFEKSVVGYQLTSDGESFLKYAEQAESSIKQAETQLQGKDAKYSGEIRITTADAIANHLLMPTVADFRQRYPDIDIEIVLSSQVIDLKDSEVDIAIRILPTNQIPPDHLIGRLIGKIALCYYATPAYIEQHNPWLDEPTAKLIGWGELGKINNVFEGSPLEHLPLTCRMNHSAMQVSAACQNIGIAALPCFIGDNVPELVRVPKCQPEIKHDLWMLSNPSHREVARLRGFKATLLSDFEQLKNRLLGRE